MNKLLLIENIKRILNERGFGTDDEIDFGKDFNKNLDNKSQYFDNLKILKDYIKESLSKDNLPWDISSKKDSCKFYPNKKLEEYINNFIKSNKIFNSKSSLSLDDFIFNFKIESDNLKNSPKNSLITYNRTHFPDGIPEIIKGLNIGYHLYKKVANSYFVISSRSDASISAQSLWQKLIRDDSFYAFFIKSDDNNYIVGIILKSKLDLYKKYFIYKLLDEDLIKNCKLDNDLLSAINFNESDFTIDKKNNIFLFDYKIYTFNKGKYIKEEVIDNNNPLSIKIKNYVESNIIL